MPPVRTFPLVQYIGVGPAADRPATPERGMVGWFASDSGALSFAKLDKTWVDVTGTASADHRYYHRLAALLEPDAIEPFQIDGFSYVVADDETRYVLASYYTRLGGAGIWEVRNPERPVPIRNVTLSGIGATASAVILDPALPTYSDARDVYLDRMHELTTLPTKFIGVAADETYTPFLPGPYGAIVTMVSHVWLTWLNLRYGGTGYNLGNENGNTAVDYSNRSYALQLPVSKLCAAEFLTGLFGSEEAVSELAGISYVLLPSTWSAIADPNAPYDFRDDFMGAALDTASDWTRVQSTAGNVEINTDYAWLKMVGNANWGTNGLFSQASIARAEGKVFLCDVYIGRSSAAKSLAVGLHDGAGQSYTDFAHSLHLNTAGLAVYENGNDRGAVGDGCTLGCIYRVRITLDVAGANSAKYEIQGLPEYPAVGGAMWEDVTPGTSSSSTTPLHAGATVNDGTWYLGDMRVY